VIRPVVAGDARTLAELEVRAWRWAYVDIVAEQDMIAVEDREARWTASPVTGASVAEVEGRIVGVVQVGPDRAEPSVGLLRGLYVEPAAQGAGIGTTLHEHAVAELRAAGFAEAVAWVFTANGHARGFFERRGWRADGATGTAAEAPERRYRHTLFT